MSFIALTACAAGIVWMSVTAWADDPYARASRNYETYCVQCHGVGRNGKGVNTPDMAVQPRDHSDSKSMGDTPDDEIIRAITDGGLSVNKSVLMPAWGGVLQPDEIKEMLAYLRHVCKCGPTQEKGL
jgi:cytochrome c oxidase cbb3-type subunit 3